MTAVLESSKNDDGIEILPGAVVVDMSVVDVHSLSVEDLRDAFDEAGAQAVEAELGPEDILGDLDLNPL